MSIRWDEIPHGEILLKMHARLNRDAANRAADDSLQHILRRRLASHADEDHRRFVELVARRLVEHLRCTRDIYRQFVENHDDCRPILEAHWVVLRCAVFPTGLDLLRREVIEYAKLSRIAGRDLSLLFGILTRTCYQRGHVGFAPLQAPDLDDGTPATDEELRCLGALINKDTLLSFRDIRDGGAVWRPFGGGPFAIDDALAMRNSFSVCGSKVGILFPEWVELRKSYWIHCAPWAEGLCSLFGSVQEELLSQWRALPLDSLAHEFAEVQQLKQIVVPALSRLPQRLERGKDCEDLAREIATIKHKRSRSGLTMDEIKKECAFFEIWKRVEVLSTDDRDTFSHPGTWEPGYVNLLLGKLYATARREVAPGTINTWRKEYRKYQKWQSKNPSKTAEVFSLETIQIKRSYRKPRRLI